MEFGRFWLGNSTPAPRPAWISKVDIVDFSAAGLILDQSSIQTFHINSSSWQLSIFDAFSTYEKKVARIWPNIAFDRKEKESKQNLQF